MRHVVLKNKKMYWFWFLQYTRMQWKCISNFRSKSHSVWLVTVSRLVSHKHAVKGIVLDTEYVIVTFITVSSLARNVEMIIVRFEEWVIPSKTIGIRSMANSVWKEKPCGRWVWLLLTYRNVLSRIKANKPNDIRNPLPVRCWRMVSTKIRLLYHIGVWSLEMQHSTVGRRYAIKFHLLSPSNNNFMIVWSLWRRKLAHPSVIPKIWRCWWE